MYQVYGLIRTTQVRFVTTSSDASRWWVQHARVLPGDLLVAALLRMGETPSSYCTSLREEGFSIPPSGREASRSCHPRLRGRHMFLAPTKLPNNKDTWCARFSKPRSFSEKDDTLYSQSTFDKATSNNEPIATNDTKGQRSWRTEGCNIRLYTTGRR